MEFIKHILIPTIIVINIFTFFLYYKQKEMIVEDFEPILTMEQKQQLCDKRQYYCSWLGFKTRYILNKENND